MNIHEYLQQYKGQTIYYKPNPGNGGDALIALGAYQLFEELGISFEIIKDDNIDLKGKVVFYGGGGNLVRYYNQCADFIRQHHAEAKQFVLLPHTVDGHEDLLSELGSNVTIICREVYSYEHVCKFTNIGKVLLMDDLAFTIDPQKLLAIHQDHPDIRATIKKHNAIRFRGHLQFYPFSKELMALREDKEKGGYTNHLGNGVDVSDLIKYDRSMSDISVVEMNAAVIFHILNKYKVIHTDRLHICIAAALLGKIVKFYSNSYWKNQAIFEQSIKGKYPKVEWCTEEISSKV